MTKYTGVEGGTREPLDAVAVASLGATDLKEGSIRVRSDIEERLGDFVEKTEKKVASFGQRVVEKFAAWFDS